MPLDDKIFEVVVSRNVPFVAWPPDVQRSAAYGVETWVGIDRPGAGDTLRAGCWTFAADPAISASPYHFVRPFL